MLRTWTWGDPGARRVADRPPPADLGRQHGILALLAVATLVLSLAPKHLSPGALLPHVVVHLLGFGGLTVLAVWWWRRIVPAAVAVFGLSLLIEILQALVPWRQGSLRDVAINLLAVGVGAAIGGWMISAMSRTRDSRRDQP